MRKRRLLALVILFGAMLPAMACNDPTSTRIPDEQDGEDDSDPDDEDDIGFLLRFSTEPVVV